MNFFKEYNRIEHLYSRNPDTKDCYNDMSYMFADLLQQFQKQVSRVVTSQRSEKADGDAVKR